jgi:methionyl-tRNA formyltransferase
MVNARGLRVVFFGTPDFAVPTLDRILTSRHGIVGVVTQPDRARGRGHRTTDSPVKARALDAGLPVLQPATLKDPQTMTALASLQADIGVVAAYGKILTEAVLAVPPLGIINVHASLLPRHRGAAPVHRAIIAGDRETGVTIMRIVKALDAGPMLGKANRRIGNTETSDAVERDLAALGADLLVDALDRLSTGAVEEIPQDEGQATYAHRLTKDDGIVEWSKPALEIHNLVRGLHPWPHAYTFHEAGRLILHRSVANMVNGNAPPGTIVAAHGDALHVATGEGTLEITQLQSEGKRVMSTREFLAGSSLRVGHLLMPHS